MIFPFYRCGTKAQGRFSDLLEVFQLILELSILNSVDLKGSNFEDLYLHPGFDFLFAVRTQQYLNSMIGKSIRTYNKIKTKLSFKLYSL